MGPFLDRQATIKKSPSTAYRLPTGLTTRFRSPRAVGTDLPEYHLCSDTNTNKPELVESVQQDGWFSNFAQSEEDI